MSTLDDLPNAKWAPKPVFRYKTHLQAETRLAEVEEKLRTNAAMVDHLCHECAELRKDKARLDAMCSQGWTIHLTDWGTYRVIDCCGKVVPGPIDKHRTRNEAIDEAMLHIRHE